MRSRISAAALSEVKTALKKYSDEVLQSDLSPRSQEDYIYRVDIFIRWLEYEYESGCRLAPYAKRSAIRIDGD